MPEIVLQKIGSSNRRTPLLFHRLLICLHQSEICFLAFVYIIDTAFHFFRIARFVVRLLILRCSVIWMPKYSPCFNIILLILRCSWYLNSHVFPVI